MALIIRDAKHNPVPRRLSNKDRKDTLSSQHESAELADVKLGRSKLMDSGIEVQKNQAKTGDSENASSEKRLLIEQTLQEKREREEERVKTSIDDGFKQGYEEGLEKARTEVMNELQTEVDALAEIRSSLNEAIGEQISGVDEVALQIVLESINKVFGSVMQDNDASVAMIRKVIEQTQNRANLFVRVSKKDFVMLQDNNIELIENKPGDNIQVIADDRVILGGCILETDAGSIDGRLETQLAHLREVIVSASEQDKDSGGHR